jgi:hypothetical protein
MSNKSKTKSKNVVALVGRRLSQQLGLAATLGRDGSCHIAALAAKSLDNVL